MASLAKEVELRNSVTERKLFLNTVLSPDEFKTVLKGFGFVEPRFGQQQAGLGIMI